MKTIKELQDETLMTEAELAYRARVSISTISRIRGGDHAATRRSVMKILKVLGEELGRAIPLEEVNVQLAEEKKLRKEPSE